MLRRCARLALMLGLLAGGARDASADGAGDFSKKLAAYQAEVKMMRTAVRPPEHAGKPRTVDIISRRIVDAEVNFSIKNYDDAAVVLYDIVEKHANHPSWDEALYYLSESLYQKGDLVGSRNAFSKLVRSVGAKSKFYQHSLERLVELTLKFEDTNTAEEWLRLLDQVPAGQQRDSVPYVRGKYEFFRQNYDTAIELFGAIPKKSRYYFQSRYFLATTLIAKKELDAAIKELGLLVKSKPINADAGRVIELSHLAMGRVFYEQNQLSRAIDAYRHIPRQSDLLDEVLYETAWVYVKNKNYEKALQSLEMLALSDPNSSRLPDVKILEGNLRIRMAKDRVVNGASDGVEEYQQAVKLFEELKGLYENPNKELLRIMAEHADPTRFVAQLTGRSSRALESQAVLPEVAASWLLDEADVKKSVAIEADLELIAAELADTEATIERLERALGTSARINAFPALAEKRLRATSISEDIDRMLGKAGAAEKQTLAERMSPAEKAELGKIAGERKALLGRIQGVSGKTGDAESRTQAARNQYVALDKQAAETYTVLENTSAELRGLAKYIDDVGRKNLPKADLAEVEKEMRDIAAEVDKTKAEVEGTRREVTYEADSIGAGDDATTRVAELRKELRQNYAREAAILGPKSPRYAALVAQAAAINAEIDAMSETIYRMVDEGLIEVQAALAEERGHVAAYHAEYASCNDESLGLGGEVIAQGFGEVVKKFADVLIRSDVGVADVAWSLHESADETARRVSIEQARERKTLEADFADVLREMKDDGTGKGAQP